MARERIDERLVRDGLAPSRSHAQKLVMAGSVLIDGQRCDKSSRPVKPEQGVELVAREPYVSRAGRKLAGGLDRFSGLLDEHALSVSGAHAIDLGSSTGGFTDCLLQRGASGVIAVDVGYGQLHPTLRQDERVVVMERTNARHLTPEDLPWAPDLLVCDASFISLRTLLPGPLACMAQSWWGIVLIKPQFEAGTARMRKFGRGGVIRDDDVRQEVLQEVVLGLEGLGIAVLATHEAEPKGPKGNTEYVALIRGSR